MCSSMQSLNPKLLLFYAKELDYGSKNEKSGFGRCRSDTVKRNHLPRGLCLEVGERRMGVI